MSKFFVFNNIVLLCVFLSCTDNKQSDDQIKHEITECSSPNSATKEICILSENLDYINKGINDIILNPDSSFIISTSDAIIKYDKEGNQSDLIGRQGRGPQEFLTITSLYQSKNKLYAWCGNSQKLFSYDSNGQFINEHKINGLSNRSFAIYEDNLLCQYHPSPVGEDVITIHNILTQEKIWSVKLEKQEDELLNFAYNAGGIHIKSDTLFWIQPSELSIFALPLRDVNNDSKQCQVFSFDDPDFIIGEITNASELINQNRIEAINWINKNSRVVDLFFNKETICIAAEVGIIDYSNKKMDFLKRKIKVYKVDRKKRSIYSVIIDYSENFLYYKFMNNTFFTVTMEEKEDQPIYKLKSLEIF